MIKASFAPTPVFYLVFWGVFYFSSLSSCAMLLFLGGCKVPFSTACGCVSPTLPSRTGWCTTKQRWLAGWSTIIAPGTVKQKSRPRFRPRRLRENYRRLDVFLLNTECVGFDTKWDDFFGGAKWRFCDLYQTTIWFGNPGYRDPK